MAMRGGLGTGGSGNRMGGLGGLGGNPGGVNNQTGITGRPPINGANLNIPIGYGKEVLDKAQLIVSLVIGIIGAIVARSVYEILVGSIFRPVVIMLTIGVFFAIAGLSAILFNLVRGMYDPSFSLGNAFMVLAITFVITLGLSFLFEWIYELGGGFKPSEAGSYVIIIDDSGSMSSSDPANERYAALDAILEDKPDDFPYAVYRFADDTKCVRELLPKSEKSTFVDVEVGGGTSIKGALSTVLEDYTNGGLQNAENLKVLLLSDGVATDIGLFSSINGVLKDYAKNGISISTVGLGNGVDENLMKKIADSTGGVYINVADVSDLSDTMTTAIESYYKRDLLTYRVVYKHNILYVIERILFMGVIGSLIGAALVILCNGKKQNIGIAIAVAKGIGAAVILEVFINGFGMSERLVNYIFFVIIGLIISWLFVRISNPPPRSIDPPKTSENGKSSAIEQSKNLGQKGNEKSKSGPKIIR